MRQLMFSFLLVIVTVQFVAAQNKEEAAVINVLKIQEAAWNKGDIPAFMLGYWNNDSLTFIGKAGVTYGWKSALANYQKNYPDTAAMGKLHFELPSVKQYAPDLVYVIGKWHLTRSIGDIGGHFTLVFRKIKGSWVVISDHTS